MRRVALFLAVAGLSAACIEKPLRPSDRPKPDAAPGEVDGAPGCDDPPDERIAWDADDTVRFDQVTADLNDDCFDDLLLPGSTDEVTHGVFVVLGRSAADFFTGGYDHFIETTDSEPLRVAATDLVGMEPLDLVVFARSSSAVTEGEAEVLVFEGVGDGSFLDRDLSRRIADTFIPPTALDEPGHFTVEQMSAAAGGPDEIIIGDSGSAFVIAPPSWTPAGLADAQVVEPFGEAGAQGVMVAPSGRPGADDLVQVDTQFWNWFINTGGLDYGTGLVNAMVDSGPRMLRLPDVRADTDIASVSIQNERLSFLFFNPPPTMDSSGSMVVKAFGSSVDAADDVIDAVELIGLGGGTAPELLVFDSGATDAMARLWLFHDIADAGDTVDPAGDASPVEVAEWDEGHPYNRMAVGAFRGPGQTKVYLFSSAPGGETPPVCWLPDPDSGELSRCN